MVQHIIKQLQNQYDGVNIFTIRWDSRGFDVNKNRLEYGCGEKFRVVTSKTYCVALDVQWEFFYLRN